MAAYLWLTPLGFFVGMLGTLIGAGGGFLLVPVLLLVYPNESSAVLTAISLAVIFLNATSGTVAYARQGRVDFVSGAIFAAASMPGAFIGAYLTTRVPRHSFDLVFGSMMIVGAYFISRGSGRIEQKPPAELRTSWRMLRRKRKNTDGTVQEYAVDWVVGSALSFFVGFMASFLGIGGGIVHVPMLVHLMDFPVHFATATSHFTLAVMALCSCITHYYTGDLQLGLTRVLWLGLGVIPGAQVGARLSKRISGTWILRALSLAVVFVGVRILFKALTASH